MITTLLIIILLVVLFDMLLNWLPVGRYRTALAVVLLVLLILWLAGGLGEGRVL